MSVKPPVRDDMVRMTGLRDQTEQVGPGEVIRRDEYYGGRKLVTHILGNGLDNEADVFGYLGADGFLKQDLVWAVNAMCVFCSNNWYLRPSNKTFWFTPPRNPCPHVGPDSLPVGVAWDVGKLTVREALQCPTCRKRMRISEGRCEAI